MPIKSNKQQNFKRQENQRYNKNHTFWTVQKQ